ncbi:MAG: histidinol-phosphate transaminase [Candidatus Bathyarchaeia archaeon]|nr:histidinol-phosphate transaminase [Candidatus Bathyarchaeota archaeon]
MKLLVRSEIEGIIPYDVKDLLEIKNLKTITKLDLNENLLISNKEIKRIISKAVKEIDFRFYPKPYGKEAVEAIAKFYNLKEEKIFVANGSDDLLDKLSKAFIPKGSNVIINEPTFTMYSFFIKLYGGEKREVLLTQNFQLNVEDILNKCDSKTSMVIICSPNNPTGNQFNVEDIEKILKSFDGLVIVDEAYADFGDFSMLNLIEKYENLVILRSFSKSFGLASIRAGFAAANEKVISYLTKVSGPFLVNSITQKIIKVALEEFNLFKEVIKRIIKEREWLFNQLKKIDGVTPFPSKTNFILFRINKNDLSTKSICTKLKCSGIYIKDRSKDPLLEKCLRVTVGTRRMNVKFISELKKILKEEH